MRTRESIFIFLLYSYNWMFFHCWWLTSFFPFSCDATKKSLSPSAKPIKIRTFTYLIFYWVVKWRVFWCVWMILYQSSISTGNKLNAIKHEKHYNSHFSETFEILILTMKIIKNGNNVIMET